MKTIALNFQSMLSAVLGSAEDSGAVMKNQDAVPTGRWRDLEKILPRTDLLVTLQGGRKIKGKFAGTTDNGLSVRGGERTKHTAKESVLQVHRRVRNSGKPSARLGALLGYLLGGSLGLLLYGADAGPFYNPAAESAGDLFASMTGVGAWGALVGAALGFRIGRRRTGVLLYDEGIPKAEIEPEPEIKNEALPAESTAHRQPLDSLDILQRLQPGREIHVEQLVMGPMRGTFLGLTETKLLFRVKKRRVSAPRWDLIRVGQREETKRLKNAFFGMGTGAAAGVAAGFLAGAVYPEAGETPVFVFALLRLGVGVGGALGALLAHPNYRTIFQTTRNPRGLTPRRAPSNH